MKLKPFLPAFLWLAIVVIISGYPGKNLPKAPFNEFDKLVHLLIYAVLSFLIMVGFAYQHFSLFKSITQYVISLTISIYVGGIVELLQEFIFINRYGDWFDFLANAIGAVLGLIFFSYYKK